MLLDSMILMARRAGWQGRACGWTGWLGLAVWLGWPLGWAGWAGLGWLPGFGWVAATGWLAHLCLEADAELSNWL